MIFLLCAHELKNIVRMDLQNIQKGTHKLDYDFLQYTKPEYHKCLDKDLNTFDLYKLCLKDILN